MERLAILLKDQVVKRIVLESNSFFRISLLLNNNEECLAVFTEDAEVSIYRTIYEVYDLLLKRKFPGFSMKKFYKTNY